MELYFFHISLGCVSGLIFSLMFINFDATWKKIFSWMLTFAVDGGAIALFKSTGLPIDNNFWGALGSMMMAFIVAFIVVMIIVYRITKKQDDGNVITFKDIFLGQKSHINIYYKQRKDEITKKILPELEERERKIEEEKEAIAEQDRRLRKEWNKLNDASNKKIKMILPVNNHIIVSKTYFESLPSYMSDLAECIKDLHKTTNSLIEKNKTLTLSDLKAYLFQVSLNILQNIIKPRDSRVHFRYYDEKTDGYKMLTSMNGDNTIDTDLTLIPYKQNSLIKKSSECHFALIKSINTSYNFKSNNFSIWQDYITFAFYNIKKDDKVCLSFGISVTNSARNEDLFHFLIFAKFEQYLQKMIKEVDSKFDIVNILYGGKSDG